MFKKLKDKLTEEMKQSPARLQASMQQLAQVVPGITNISTSELSASNDNFSITEGDDETPKNTPEKYKLQAVDLTSYSSNSMGLSRTSSVNSVTSADISGLFPIYENLDNSYHLQSDVEQSASEVDDHINPQFDQVTKEQIYAAYRKAQSKYHKYRGRYSDLANYYREMDRSKSKLESLLVETQDKALRRIADLKEQCLLEQQAKAHLEEALRNDIEEKDHIIDTLNTKVKLLQASGSSSLLALRSQENLIDIGDNQSKLENNHPTLLDNSSSEQESISKNVNSTQLQLTEENQLLINKIDKLESLIQKYKESLKRSKDRVTEVMEEKMILERDLELVKNSNSNQLHEVVESLNEAKAEIIILNEKINTMKQVEEESVISLAENKLSIHRELEIKESQIKKLTLELKDAMQIKDKIQNATENNLEIAESSKEFVDGETQSCEEYIDIYKYKQHEETIVSLNQMIEKYTAQIDEAEEKINKQNLETIKLTEDYKDISEQLKNRSSDFSRLENEIIECRSIIKQLENKCTDNARMNDKLINEKNNLIHKIVQCMTTAKLLRDNHEKLKLVVEDGEIRTREDLTLVSKTFQEFLNCQLDLNNSSLDKITKSYESELLEKNTEIESISDKLNDSEMIKSQLIEEIDNLNSRIVNMKKQLDENNSEIVKLRNIESEYNAQIDQLKILNEKIEIMEREHVEQEEMIELHNNKHEILIKDAEKIYVLEIQVKELNEQIEMYKESIEKYDKQLKDTTGSYDELLEKNKVELENNTMQLREESEKVQKLIEDNLELAHKHSELNTQIEQLTDIVRKNNEKIETLEISKVELIKMIESKDSEIEKFSFERTESTKIVQDKNLEIEKLVSERSELSKMVQDKDLEIKKLMSELAELAEMVRSKDVEIKKVQSESAEVMSLNDELKNKESEYQKLEQMLGNLSNENSRLNSELEQLNKINSSLMIQIEETSNLMSVVEDLRNHKEKVEIENKELKNIENELRKANQELQTGKSLLEERVDELDTLSQVHLKEIADLKEKILKNSEVNEVEKLQMENYNDREIEETRLQRLVEELQFQLQEKEKLYITCQTTHSHSENENNKLKSEIEALNEQLKTFENEQSLRMQQLVKEFQARLHDKDSELQAALDQKFDWQKNYESELVKQYREQLKDFQIELTAKSEEIEKLKAGKNPESNKEIEKLVDTIATIKLEHANELKEADVKWQETLKQKCDQLEIEHTAVINELKNEWKKNKHTEENPDLKPEELENMSTIAMAAVQSNTGSFHSLQQTLSNQRRELTELRKLVKLKHETLDDSTEIEYLRNILYEYMMGKETLVLAKVIAAVVKFDQDQTNKILKKEEDKLTLLGSLGLT